MSPEYESQPVKPLSTPNSRLKVKDFIWSKHEWPNLQYNDFRTQEDIPVLSLSATKDSNEYEEMCKKMVGASGRWGFFRLTDHGVPEEIIENMMTQCSRLFCLPIGQKIRGERREGVPLGYSASNPDYNVNLPWAEILQLLHSKELVVSFAKKVFGDEHPTFSEALINYMDALNRLGMVILEMLAHGLGLPDDYFTKNFEEKESTMLRVNNYPPCPLPERCLGLGSHTDPHAMTILLQDEVGGLQVQKHNGEWIGIRPIPKSFILNIGDVLEAWTNGRLQSVIHRAVVNREQKRLSVAYFLCPAGNTLINCPIELMNETNGRRKYSAFTWDEFRKELLKQKRVVGKTALNRYLISHDPTNTGINQ